MKTDQKICIGEITNVHGIRGQVAMRIFAENPDLLRIKGAITDRKGGQVFSFKTLKQHRNAWLAELDGVTTRDQAEALKGSKLYIARDLLPPSAENEIYHVDLIGMEVETGGEIIGAVIAVQNFGASDLLEIKRAGAKSFYLPYSEQTILAVKDDKISVSIPPGLLELYE